MNNIKHIFLDADGTILDRIIPESSLYAIKQARNNGHKVYLATGRSRTQITRDTIMKIGFDGFVMGGGNYAEVDGKTIFEKRFDPKQVNEIITWIKNNNFTYMVEGDFGLVPADDFIEKANIALSKKVKDNKNIDDYKIDKIIPVLSNGFDYDINNVDKIFFLVDGKNYRKEIFSTFDYLTYMNWDIKYADGFLAELTQKEINKAIGVSKIIDYKKINILDTMAFGDSAQDIPMIQYCNIGVAMGNAKQEVKDVSNYITSNCMEDGLYNAFKHFKII